MAGFRYTQEQLDFIREHSDMRRHALTELVNERFGLDKTEPQIRDLCKARGWKSKRRGPVTPNAGQFQHRHQPHNHCPIGTERRTTGDNYIKVKIAEPNVWEFKHILLWREHHGEIPEGRVVTYADGDRSNCVIENLVLITRQQMLYLNRNGYDQLPAELRESMRVVAKAACKVFEIERAKQ